MKRQRAVCMHWVLKGDFSVRDLWVLPFDKQTWLQSATSSSWWSLHLVAAPVSVLCALSNQVCTYTDISPRFHNYNQLWQSDTLDSWSLPLMWCHFRDQELLKVFWQHPSLSRCWFCPSKIVCVVLPKVRVSAKLKLSWPFEEGCKQRAKHGWGWGVSFG